jgi:hypothetical protein
VVIGKVSKLGWLVGWLVGFLTPHGWWCLHFPRLLAFTAPLPRRNYSLSLVSPSPPPSHPTSHPILSLSSHPPHGSHPILIHMVLIPSGSHPILLHLVLNPLSSHLTSGSHPIILNRVLIPFSIRFSSHHPPSGSHPIPDGSLCLCVWLIALSPCLVSCLSQSLSSVSVCLCLCPWSSLELFPSRVS